MYVLHKMIKIHLDLGLMGLTGIFGAATQNAVKNYQTSRGLASDGIVGCNTWRSLQEEVVGTGATSTTIN